MERKRQTRDRKRLAATYIALLEGFGGAERQARARRDTGTIAVDANKLLVLLAAFALLGGLDVVAGGRAADKEAAEGHDDEVRGAQHNKRGGDVCYNVRCGVVANETERGYRIVAIETERACGILRVGLQNDTLDAGVHALKYAGRNISTMCHAIAFFAPTKRGNVPP